MSKKAWARLAKALLFIAFLWQTGIISEIAHSIASNSTSITIEQDTARHSKLQAKVNKAKALGKAYNADMYFDDITEIHRDSLDVCAFGSVLVNDLFQISWQNCETEELIKARDKHYTQQGSGFGVHPWQQQYAKKQLDEGIKTKGGILNYLFQLYLAMLPWVGILFLIWLFENRSDKKKIFKTPISFIGSIVFYPVVLLVVLFVWFREQRRGFAAEVSVRRTKEKIFSLLSDDEISRIKEFAQSSLPMTAWRNKLRNEGKTYQHSLVTALIATVLLMVIAQPLLQAAEKSICKEINITQIIKSTNNVSPPGSVGSHDNLVTDCMLPVIPYRERGQEKLGQIYIDLIVKCLDGFISEVEHIPNTLTVIRLINRNFQLKIKDIKNVYNKKYNISSSSIVFVC